VEQPSRLVELTWDAGGAYAPNGFPIQVHCEGGARIDYYCFPDRGCSLSTARERCDASAAPEVPESVVAEESAVLIALASGALSSGQADPETARVLVALARRTAERIPAIVSAACGGGRCTQEATRLGPVAASSLQGPWRFAGARGGGAQVETSDGPVRPDAVARFELPGGTAELELSGTERRLRLRRGDDEVWHAWSNWEWESVGDARLSISPTSDIEGCRVLRGAAVPVKSSGP
jgi:hypothetical protein